MQNTVLPNKNFNCTMGFDLSLNGRHLSFSEGEAFVHHQSSKKATCLDET